MSLHNPLRYGSHYYKSLGLVAVTIYIPKRVRAAYMKAVAKLKREGKILSAQKLMAAVLTKNAPR